MDTMENIKTDESNKEQRIQLKSVEQQTDYVEENIDQNLYNKMFSDNIQQNDFDDSEVGILEIKQGTDKKYGMGLEENITVSKVVQKENNQNIDNTKSINKIPENNNGDYEDVELDKTEVNTNNNTILNGVDIEQENYGDAELEEIKINNNGAVLDSADIKEKDKKEDRETKEKEGSIILWGLLLCSAILLGPLGGGFAFILTPLQASSFLLVPFYSRGKKKRVYVNKKKNGNTKDRLITDLEGKGVIDNAGEIKDMKGFMDGILKIYNEKKDKNNKYAKKFGELVEKNPNLITNVTAFTKLLSTVINEEQVKIMQESFFNNDVLLNTLNRENFVEKMEKLVTANEKEKTKIANKIADDIRKISNKIPELKDFVNDNNINSLSNNIIEKAGEILEYNNITKDINKEIISKKQEVNKTISSKNSQKQQNNKKERIMIP